MTDIQADILLQYRLEQFYYREAGMLDNREYQSWLALCLPEISYSMPARVNKLVDNRESGNESMISVERELETIESEEGSPIRDEGYAHLMVRVDRSFKKNAWAENPPARTRRIIGNLEVTSIENDRIKVISNFHLHYSRPGSANFLYAGQRRDELVETGGSFMIAAREIVMDFADIEYPTLGLFF